MNGLRSGAKVRVSGLEAGEVLEVQVPNRPDDRFRLRLRIKQNLHALVRGDSVATIKTMGLAGSTFLDIQKGTPRAPESASESTIPSREPFDIAELMQQGSDLLKTTQTSIVDLRTKSDRALQSVNSTAHHTDETIVAMRPDLQATLASARRTAENISEIVAQVEQGHGTVGELLKNQRLADSVDQTVENARKSSLSLNSASARVNDTIADLQRRDLLGRAQAVLDNTRQITEELNQAIASFTSGPPEDQNTAANLRDTIASMRTAMANLAADTEAIKHNFFLRGFFKRRGYFNLNTMTPAQYRASKFVKEDSSERVWLRTEELFSSEGNGKEALTTEGQRQIDSAMSALVPYLPNSGIVVEGYAIQGSASERFLRAKQRAAAVQSYIEQRFKLQPNMVAVVPMSDSPPPGVGKSVFDGVSLVLIH